MTDKSIYSYGHYLDFLLDFERSNGKVTRGFWTQLAKATGCQTSYISRILAKGAHFSQEQTLRLCKHLLLSDEETDYFLNLVEFEKSGSPELKSFYRKKLDVIREKNLDIHSRIKPSVTLNSEALATFYSQWYYLAIHVLLLNPNFRSSGLIAKALGLPLPAVEKAIRFLLEQNLVSLEHGELVPGQVDTHLEQSSPFIKQHHSNWRIAAIESMRGETDRDLHYSSVSSLSEEAVRVLREKFVSLIEDYVATVKPTANETLYSFNLDFFKLLK